MEGKIISEIVTIQAGVDEARTVVVGWICNTTVICLLSHQDVSQKWTHTVYGLL